MRVRLRVFCSRFLHRQWRSHRSGLQDSSPEQSVNSLEIHGLAKLHKVILHSLLVIEEDVPDGVA